MTLRLDGKPVAEVVDAETRQAISARGASRAPSLVSVHRDVDSPFRFYLRRQSKAAAAVGVTFRDEPIPADAGPDRLVATLAALDRNAGVDGVLLEHPLPPPFDFRAAIAALRPEKDVDGVGALNLGRLVQQHPVHVPAVARAAVRIAQQYRLPLEGERVVVLGRSETVGLPLGLLLASRQPGLNATVTVAHSRSHGLESILRDARTIFSCVGHPGLLTRANVPEGAHVVDVGLSSVPDPAKPGASKSAGDADAASLDGWAASLTPVPGGVGPVTVAELMSSATRAWQLARAVGSP